MTKEAIYDKIPSNDTDIKWCSFGSEHRVLASLKVGNDAK